jgi:TonB-linked SusC/RagA family outer membrane protein
MKKRDKKIFLAREKFLNVMRSLFILVLLNSFFTPGVRASNEAYYQDVKINLNLKNVKLTEVFASIQKQCDYWFLYNDELVRKIPPVSIEAKNEPLIQVLTRCLSNTGLDFELKDKVILIKERPEKKQTVPGSSNNVPKMVTISGIIRSMEGSPLAGANVLIKGTQKGVTSAQDGTYSIDTPEDATLVFFYMGYQKKEAAIKGRSVIDVVLQEEPSQLKEVTVNAGYYTVKEKERTGSIAKVSAREIGNQPVNNPLEALQGRVTGVEIVQNTGVPGGGFEVKIRGRNSIAAGNEPLYIIDGVPYDISTLGNRNIQLTIMPGGMINPLNTLDPASIEFIEILKDADATAIYGSRGANGVILITTKKGFAGKTSLNIEASGTSIAVTRLPKLLNTEQYLQMRREAFANDGLTDYSETDYDVNGTWDQTRYTDWQEKLIGGTAYNSTIKASISGGNEKTRFNIGGSFMKETTVFPMDFNYRRITAYAGFTHNSTDNRFTMTFTANYGTDKNYVPGTDLTRISLILPPNAPKLYNDDGSLNWENSTWTNPMAALECKYRNSTRNLIVNTVLNYKILNWLEIKTNLGYNRSDLTETVTNPHTQYPPAWGTTSASSYTRKNNSSKDSWIIEPQLNASYKIGEGKLSVTVGCTFQEQNKEQLTLGASGFTNDYFMNTLSASSTQSFRDEVSAQYRYNAVYARANYNLKEKYLFNLTGRRDGSSRFGPERRFANFGAVGVAWLFYREKFFMNYSWLSFGKLRASLGTTGNDQIGDYQYLNTYKITNLNYNGYLGLSPSHLQDPIFAWEKNRKAEAALEAGLWNDRLNFEISYYNNRSGNQLVGIPLPGTTGFSSISANLNAVVENSGWEVSINSFNIQRNNFQWNSSFNLTIPKNKLVDFPGLEGSTYASQYIIGYPLSIYKLYKLKGVNAETGIFEFEDFNGDGIVTSTDDRKFIADLTTRYYGNISNSLIYKNWNLNFLFQFVKKMGLNEFYYTDPPGTMFNQPVGVMDRWQKPGDKATMQAYTASWDGNASEAYYRFTTSDGIITDASFVRLKSLSLSYKLPLSKVGPGYCQLYLQGQNLLTFTKFRNGDPEQLTAFLSPVRRISFGIRIVL